MTVNATGRRMLNVQEDRQAVLLRAATIADAPECGRIIHDAFRAIAERHGFEADFPTVDAGIELARSFIASQSIFSLVAEVDGRVIGSNFLGEGDAIRGVGPITIDPDWQGGGVGRKLMEAVIERANGALGVRLLQDSFNMASVSLYASLGFEAREPILVMTGRPTGVRRALGVRPMAEQDIEACNALCADVHGFARSTDLADALRFWAPVVRERDGRITGYLTAPTFWIANHGVAETEEDMQAMLLGAAELHAGPLSFLLPIRQGGLFRWCLAEGFRAAKPMTLMTIGQYQDPRGIYLPSVFY